MKTTQRSEDAREVGGKAAALARLRDAGFPVPGWFAVRPGEMIGREDLARRMKELGGDRFAVRSSARGEDGGAHSFAGQFDTFLRVPPGEVAGRIEAVRASAHGEAVDRYRAERGVGAEASETAVIVQRMIDARAAGVAFSADPVGGRRRVAVVSATPGTGERLVSGELDGEDWVRADDGRWVVRPQAEGAVLGEEDAAAVAALARRCEAHFGRPQDIEWALDDRGGLWLLQSRPVTTLGTVPDPDDELRIWDNSNIAESYGGVSSAMTFSFARRIYEHVYREFCRLMRVPARRVRRADPVFPRMLGMVEGRVYYNLLSWYRVLALLPGFSLNRKAMEQMMGVKESMPEEIVGKIAEENREGRLRDGLALARTVFGLAANYLFLQKQIRSFRARLGEAMGTEFDGGRMGGDDLVAHYRSLEQQLLKHWDAPLVNDFFAMIFHGLLRKLVAAWCGDSGGGAAAGLLADCGEIISAEPARRIRRMGEAARRVEGLPEMLSDPARPWREREAALREVPELARAYDAYLKDFGDRCLEELKLESPTVGDDPETLLASIGAMAMRGTALPPPALASKAGCPRPGGWRGAVFGWVLRQARARVRDRENLRFDRTRVFGRVRRIVCELGARLHADGQLDEPGDVFHLELDELLGAWEGTRTAVPLCELARARRAEFRRCMEAEPPPDRFETRGPLHRYSKFEPARTDAAAPAGEGDKARRIGLGASPGLVRGRVRVVSDPRGARLEPGEILVARQTDPGWVVLFPCAVGLVVERGSVLSHSAIVSRELGLPCVVGVSGACQWLQTGEEVEIDGTAGAVKKVGGEGGSG